MNQYIPNRCCPKCGGKIVCDRYEPQFALIVRKCQRCEHRWEELPLDRQPEEASR